MRITRRSDTLPLQQINLIDVRRNFSTEYHDNDRQADGGFTGRNRDHEQCRQLTGHRREVMGERDKIDVRRIQHDLDRHQDNDEIPADQDAQQSRQKLNATYAERGIMTSRLR